MADRTFSLMTKLSLNDEDFKKGIDSVKSNVRNLVLGVEGATGNIKEMRSALNSLRSISFAGKSIEEINAINKQIGELTDKMGDLKAMQKATGTEFGSLMAKGLQAISALGEIFVGVASLFGVSKEKAEKYQQAMVSLIGVTQALGTIQDFIEQKTLLVIVARIKETASTIAQTIATWAQTAATWALNASLAVVLGTIGLIVLATGALVIGVVKLVEWFKEEKNSLKEVIEEQKLKIQNMKMLKDVQNEVSINAQKNFVDEYVKIENLRRVIANKNLTDKERNRAYVELNNLVSSSVGNLTKEESAYGNVSSKLNLYIQKLKDVAKAKALEQKLSEQYVKQFENEQKIKDAAYNLEFYNLMLIAETKKLNSIDPLNKSRDWELAKGVVEIYQDKIESTKGSLKSLQSEQDGLNNTINDLSNKLGEAIPKMEEFSKAGNKGLDDKNKLLLEAQKLVKWWNENPLGKEAPKNFNETRTFKDVGSNDFNSKIQGKINLKPISYDFFTNNLNSLKQYGVEYAKIVEKNWDKVNELDISGINKARDAYSNFLESVKPGTSMAEAFAGTISDLDRVLLKFEVLQQAANIASGAINSLADAFITMAQGGKVSFGQMVAGILSSIRQLLIGYMIQAILGLTAKEVSTKGIVGLGFAAAGIIAIEALFAKYSNKFEYGGIVPGTSTTGDKVHAMVNSGEMILNKSQQANLFAMINSGGVFGNGDVQFKIRGQELVGVLSNYNKKITNTR